MICLTGSPCNRKLELMNCVHCVVDNLCSFLKHIFHSPCVSRLLAAKYKCNYHAEVIRKLYVISVLDVCDMVCVDLSSCGPVAVGGVYFMLWCVVVQLPTCMAW